jgi:limonene-1,2-epoxide hydrolase
MTPLATLEAFLRAFERFDFDAAFALVAEECDYRNMPDPGTVHVGPKAARAFLEAFFAPTSANEFIVLRAVEQGDVVMVERLDRHKVGEAWLELPVTGVFEVRDGRITVWHDYFDMASLERQFPRG